MSDYVVAWADILEYLKERREHIILDLGTKEDKDLYRTQGKLALLNELLHIKDILGTLESSDRSAPSGASKGGADTWRTQRSQ